MKMSKDEQEKLESFKNMIFNDPIWINLVPDINDAEELREHDVPGWKLVWNNIIIRWAYATDNGTNHIPFGGHRSMLIDDLVAAYRRNADKNTLIELANRLKNPTVKFSQVKIRDKKTCTTCNKRREDLNKLKEKKSKYASTRQHPVADIKNEITTVDIQKEDACIDCAKDHLATATAYLASNAERPSMLEQELAKGEIIVASRHLLALGKNNVYNMCVKILDSCYSENSLLSVPELKKALQTLVEDR